RPTRLAVSSARRLDAARRHDHEGRPHLDHPGRHRLLARTLAAGRPVAWLGLRDHHRTRCASWRTPINKGVSMKPKEVLKAALEGEAIDRETLMVAVTKQAAKAHPDAATSEIAFARFCAAHPAIRVALDTAPARARPIFKHSVDALSWAREQHLKKAGLSDAG